MPSDPIYRLVEGRRPSAYNAPAGATEHWRVVGQWKNGKVFPIWLASSERDCLSHVLEALARRPSLKELQFLWLEVWLAEGRWLPAVELSMSRIRNELHLRRYHAKHKP